MTNDNRVTHNQEHPTEPSSDGCEGKNMTVDLSTLKIGDSVKFRDGNIVEVVNITFTESDPPVSYPYYINFVDEYVETYTRNGIFEINSATGYYDIVEIIPQVTTPAQSEPITTEALRFNEGKVPFAFLPLDLLDGAAKCMAYGAKKYTPENFRKGYSDLLSPLHSLIRHTVELQRAIQTEDVDGEKGHLLDKESGEGHVHHLVTSTLMLIHSMRLKGYKI